MSDLLSPQQQRAVDKIVKARGGLVWWKVGEGKTRIGLFAFAGLQKAYDWNLPSICLVVCRRRAFYDWRTEIELCFPDHSVYEDFIPALPLEHCPVFLLVSHAEVAKRFASLQENKLIRFVILDESWMFTNHKSTRSKAIYKLTAGRKAIALSGTIMKARDTLEIYCQAMAVQKHRLLAPSPSAFRSTFQICQTDRGFPQFYPKKGSYQKIMSELDEVADIHFPANRDRRVHEQFHSVPSTPQQRDYFHELKEFYSIDALGLEYDNALAISIKTQQIANGWIKTDSGEIITIASNKAEKLRDELHDIIASGERAVVWCAFRYDVEMLTKYLDFATVQMLGGVDFDLDAWNNGNAKVCLATEASGISVNHFAQTPYALYYSANFKWLDMQQSRGRTDRKSSSHSDCYYKYFQVVGSLDSHVYRTALESGDRERALIFQSGIKNWLKAK